ncbi:MAG: hydroxymethylglutaryl-CoA reductase, degradative [Bdellovibrionales bacterium]|nr:hydroxymethylglutaryl-CoA reductase, degradative [Bdellovibrionales bacterium]
MNQQYAELFSGFSKLDRKDRMARLKQLGVLEEEDIQLLNRRGSLDVELAEKFIENVIGYFYLPMGVAANFVINNKAYAIPMAVEETSIIAAASKTAKWIREKGEITTRTIGQEIIGQIQLAKVNDFENFSRIVFNEKQNFIEELNREVCHGLVRRGGGVRDLQIRKIQRPDGGIMAVIHLLACTCDAMGANIMNQAVEYLKIPIEKLTHEKVTMCILSNLVDSKITEARVELNDVEPEMAEKIEEASLFAELDPYRAATNNKGVLNGIDPILIATGNDWRAVESGVHAYAASSGQYRSVTKWKREGEKLVGLFEAPIVLGVVGGVTRLHPMAKMSLKMMNINSADELSEVCAAVGLVQNLGAIKALTSVGIIEGHMKLHIKNLTLGAGAEEKEIPIVQKRLEEILSLTSRISMSNAIDVLKELRGQKNKSNLKESEVLG